MTHRPTPAPETAAIVHSASDAVRLLVRLLARQAAREAIGVSKPDLKDDPHVDETNI